MVRNFPKGFAAQIVFDTLVNYLTQEALWPPRRVPVAVPLAVICLLCKGVCIGDFSFCLPSTDARVASLWRFLLTRQLYC